MPTSFSASSNACTARLNLRAQASGWPTSSASFSATGAEPGRKARLTAGRLFTFQCRGKMEPVMGSETICLKDILLVEDDPTDVEFTLTALEEHHLANRIAVVNDGAQALDYLYCRGHYKTRSRGHPILVLLD